MVSYPRTDMKIPVRPAPAPPASQQNRNFHRSSSFFDWDEGNNDPFSSGGISRSFSAQQIGPGQPVKKKPPPRPPPPKLNSHVNNSHKQAKSGVFGALFTRTNNRSGAHKQVVTKENHIPVASLIDFDSPSSSPTFTTRSSSDGVSVNSFGSDGSMSNSGNTPSAGTASLFESGFEDDFDFFGGLSSSNVKGSANDSKDPWSLTPQDPFSPPRMAPQFPQKQQVAQTRASSATWFEDFSAPVSAAAKPSAASKPPPAANVMPTIIRAKPSRPATLPKPLQNLNGNKELEKPSFTSCSSDNSESVSCSANGFGGCNSFTLDSGEMSREWSPPMPSVPPPPPPEHICEDVEIPVGELPELPPRTATVNSKKPPFGIALYDYMTSHPDDLTFKTNDKITLLKKINDEWYYGQIGQQRGMFPANFIEVVVPFEEQKPTVTALYAFPAQQWDDLDFPEGATIQVLSRINDDWLYGEYRGKLGQFPSTFVDHIPPNLPQRKT